MKIEKIRSKAKPRKNRGWEESMGFFPLSYSDVIGNNLIFLQVKSIIGDQSLPVLILTMSLLFYFLSPVQLRRGVMEQL